MSNQVNKCQPNETAACCCVDVGTIIDNDDCTATYEAIFENEAQAQEKLVLLTKEAKKVESDPCEIKSSTEKVEGGILLKASFTFSCGAENMIFQLKLR